MAMKMVLRLVALLTLILGLLMLFNVLNSDVTRYIHALLGIATIVLMEAVLAATRRRL